MQAIKDKFNDMSAMRKAKAEAKEEEKAEKELAKTRVEVAREVRLAREAEAAMDLHVNKAAEKIANEEEKYVHDQPAGGTLDPYASSFTNPNLNNAGTGPTNNLL
ncbi:late embryogenesis abundant protein 6-like [Solanum pennellii]|uniref:Late embryogenesis abundant protein 6-like n=1 Tax=Solanum pennellii TaxID=28526 RepID=A0ABM1V280_SOLPN|nr:late embryogenesis abundant protein 6-like [Solanum pennellii]